MGYISEGAGLTGRVQWTHPNFTGGARSLTASLEGQTRRGAIGTEAEQLLRGSLSLTQPYVFIPRLSFIVGPLGGVPERPAGSFRRNRHRRDPGVPARPLSSIALQYQFSARHIDEYHFGDVSAGDVSSGRAPVASIPAT